MIEERVYAILRSILEIEVNANTQVSMQNCEQWTSLAHIDIVMSVEEEFGIAFLEQDFSKITSQESLVFRVKELCQ